MSDPKPTLISEILAGCAAVEDGRKPEDIMLRAVSRLGDLATQVRVASGHAPEAAPSEDGVAGAATDLMLCIADYLRAHDLTISEARMVASMTSHPANLDKPFTKIALGWGARDKTTLQHRTSRMMECMSLLTELQNGPGEEQDHEQAWRRGTCVEAMGLCLKLIAGERPGITDDELIGMARIRIEAWAVTSAPSAPAPDF